MIPVNFTDKLHIFYLKYPQFIPKFINFIKLNIQKKVGD